MAVSIVSSIIFFLLFIILSQYVDGNGFAAQMEHRKLGGPKKTMTMRRNLEENGRQGSKIATPGSTSRHSGQKNIEKEPSKTIYGHQLRPDQIKRGSPCKIYTRCKHSSSLPQPPPLPSSSIDTQGLGHWSHCSFKCQFWIDKTVYIF